MNRLKKLADSKLPKVADTPEEFLEYLNNKCEYGFISENKKYTDGLIYYHTISPAEFSKKHIGVCWDYANYECAYFKEYFKDIPCELYYIEMASLPEEPTHTWLSYHTNNKYYIIESSWYKNRGIHEYDTKKDMIDDYVARFLKSNHATHHEAKYAVLTYKLPSIYNMQPIDFMNYVWKYGHIVFNKGLTELLKV